MSQVAPNGTVRLLANVPLDPNHEDTLWFDSKQSQLNYFLGITPVAVMNSCTRVRDGVVAFNIGEDAIRNCNYMLFQNQNFSDRWFFAYIIHTEYRNNNLTYVYYKIDAMQSYGNEITLMDCFVERENTATDGMFEHLIDEGFRVSEYVKNDALGDIYTFGEMDVIVFSGSDYENQGTVQDPDYVPVTSDCMSWQGFLNGLSPRVFHVMDNQGYWDNSEIARMTEWIDHMTELQQGDAIIGAIMFPKDMIAYGSDAMHYPITPKTLMINRVSATSKLDGYTPKNKKLYNSPFCINVLGCSDGQLEVLQPEYLGDNAYVEILANVSMTPSIMAMVEDYRGKQDSWEHTISFDAFPQVAMSLDGYKAWVASGGLARLQLNTVTSATRDIVNIGMGAVKTASGQGLYSANAQFGTESGMEKGISMGKSGIGQIAEGTLSLAEDLGNYMITMDVAKTLPPNTKGHVNTSVLMAYAYLRFYTEQRTINADVAKSIDNYFTMFGYKVNTVKKPTLHNRSRFTYVKCRGAKVEGGAPSEIITEIEAILDRGCRFWADHEHIGDYDYATNTPLGNNAT